MNNRLILENRNANGRTMLLDLGQCLRVVKVTDETFLMVKDLEGGERPWACATWAKPRRP
jgi:hypothetical protein